MNSEWPATDVIRDVARSRDGRAVTARTALYLQGNRDHLHTSGILIAADRLLAVLLGEGEPLPEIAALSNRIPSSRELVLTASAAPLRLVRSQTLALRARYRTARGEHLYLIGSAGEASVERRCTATGVSDALRVGMRVEGGSDGAYWTRLAPLGDAWARWPGQILSRHAAVEFVLEGTRQAIAARFGDLGADALVVAQWRRLVFPAWETLAGGCDLAYRLSDGALPNGTRLVHCDFSFPPDAHVGRLSVARTNAARLAATRRPAARAPRAPASPTALALYAD